MESSGQPAQTVKVGSFPHSMREVLANELKRRQRDNARYSLRAFARMLSINPSHLSKIIHGQVGVSEEKYAHFGKVLNIPTSTISYLKKKDFLLKELGRQGEWMERVEQQVDYLKLSLDQFHVIADWYHYAILELTRVEGFQSNVEWIHQKLGISIEEAQLAVDRLFRFNMLVKNDVGMWLDNSENVSNGTQDFTVEALRNMQKQILELAMKALENTAIEERLQSSMTMAIHKKHLGKAKQSIVTFQRAFATLFQEEAEPKDSVYQLSVSFFPLTQDSEV